MTHIGTEAIVTNRLILRRARIEDASDMFQNWASDPEVTKYLTWPTHSSIEITRWVLSSWVESYAQPDYYQWLIESKALEQVIGSIAVVSQRDTTAEVGYCIGRSWWHQGITSEALEAVIDYLLHRVGMQRVESNHDINNPHSGAVMAKCGMCFQGITPGGGENNQGVCDVAWYAIEK